MKSTWPSLWSTLFCDKVKAFNPASLNAGYTVPLLTGTVRGWTQNFRHCLSRLSPSID